jgi:uncharacterized caspase-like protein
MHDGGALARLIHPLLRGIAIAMALCAIGPFSDARAEPRIALVIGNANYSVNNKLANPANDARLISETLKKVGFSVTTVIDGNYNAMRQSLADFAKQAAEAGADATRLVYYAGHGLEADGANYLVPVDAKLQTEVDLQIEAIPLEVLFKIMGKRVNVVILDAGRVNPFRLVGTAGESRVIGGRGLARVDVPQGFYVAYSSSPGSVAMDGGGANSPFAEALARQIPLGGNIDAVFTRVRADVDAATGGQQIPWTSSTLRQEFAFVAPGVSPRSGSSLGSRLIDAPKRVALVIGNGAYVHEKLLTNPERDATAVAGTLKSLGFQLAGEKGVHLNVTRKQFSDALSTFRKMASEADLALIYYAGHGVIARDVLSRDAPPRNWLLPIDARLEYEDDVADEAVPLDRLIDIAASAKLANIVILDACRTLSRLPMKTAAGAPRSSGETRGLLRVGGGNRSIVAYAASERQAASDGGEGSQHSPYTASLLRHLRTPGVSIRGVFAEVYEDLAGETSTSDAQVPMTEDRMGTMDVALSKN